MVGHKRLSGLFSGNLPAMFSKMKAGNRLDSTWTQEGVIYFEANNEQSFFKVNNLYQDAMELN